MHKYLIPILFFFLTACSPSQISAEVTPASFPTLPAPVRSPTTMPSALPLVTNMPTKTQTLNSTNSGIESSAWPTQTPLPPMQLGQPFVLSKIEMLDEHNGWALETTGHLLRTTDGGFNWKDVTPPEIGFFTMGDALHAWDIVETRGGCEACPGGWAPGLITWSTVDGGQTWRRGSFFGADMLNFQPIALQFINDAKGWFLFKEHMGMSGFTYQSLVQTGDGGESWIQVHPFTDGCVSGGMIFFDEQEGWIGEDCRGLSNTLDGIALQDFLGGKAAPSLNRTTDGGNVWSSFPVPPPTVFPANFTSSEIDPNSWFYCGINHMDKISQEAFLLEWNCNTPHSTISAEVSYVFLTANGGESWHSWLSTGNEIFVNPNTGWRLVVAGGSQPNSLQQTTDGGSTWTTIKMVAWQAAQFDFVSDQLGWAIVSNGINSTLIHTVNSGKTWIEIKPVIVL